MKNFIKKHKQVIITTTTTAILIFPSCVGAADYWGDFKSFMETMIVRPSIVLAVVCAIEFILANRRHDAQAKEMSMYGLGSFIAIAGITQSALWKWF